MIQVWYHANCYDGFGAAWAAWRKFGPSATYTPVTYGKPPPAAFKGDEIYIVDFSYPRDVLLSLHKEVKLTVLDHHKTAEEDLRGLDFCWFDMKRSGAGIAWDFFHPGTERPALISLIEDRDLWRFVVPGSKEFHAYITGEPFDFKAWDSIALHLEADPDPILATGASLLKAQGQLVDKICAKAWRGRIGGCLVSMVNTGSHWSEVGNRLLELDPEAVFAASFTVRSDLAVQWSLRGRGDFDVATVAQKYKGGGHKSAAGFEAPLQSIAEFTGAV